MPRLQEYDYTRIDDMIRAGKFYQEICRECGCAKSTVSKRRKKLGMPLLQSYFREGTIDHVPFLPPPERPRLALQQKTADMTPQHRAAFLAAHRWTPEGFQMREGV